MNENEIESLKQAFKKIDVDDSGTITIDELYKAMIDQVLLIKIIFKG